MMDWNWGWGAMMFGGLAMLLFWGLVIGLLVWGIRAVSSSARPSDRSYTARSEPTPLEILQARYARGEISREEYETIRRDLETP